MIDPNTAIGAAGEGAKGIGKLAQLLEKLFGPNVTTRQANADKYAADIKMQQIRDNPDMLISFENGNVNIKAKSDVELYERAEQRSRIEEIRQEQNLERIIEIAGKEMLTVSAVSQDKVDEDWVTRFFNIVKDVSSSDMQYVWGKVLAGEIVKPGSFSLRTLDIIKNITQNEARIFEKIRPYIVKHNGDYLLPKKQTLLNKYGVHYGMILQLDECGLINSSGSAMLDLFSKNAEEVLYTSKKAMLLEKEKNSAFNLPLFVYPLTTPAKELLNALEIIEDENFFVDYAKTIYEEDAHKRITVRVHNINKPINNGLEVYDAPVQEFFAE